MSAVFVAACWYLEQARSSAVVHTWPARRAGGQMHELGWPRGRCG